MAESGRFNCAEEKAWCPGCGNHPLLEGIKTALEELGKEPHEVLVASGIGQAAKLPHYIKANGFNGLHGRALPPAVGIKVANDDLTVIIHTGDGDSYGEGGNHLLHNIRRNVDITHFVHDNQIYGLTKGQASPTTGLGQITGIQTEGVVSETFNPIALAISLDCSFVARTFVGDKEHMVETMKQAISHRGYALVDILQPCVVFNKVNTFKWYKDRVYKIDDSHNPTDKIGAFKLSMEFGDKIPIGLIYKNDRRSYTDLLEHIPAEPLVKRRLEPKNAERFMTEFY